MCAQQTATARAHSNIALIKYWGKRDTSAGGYDSALNLPAVGSISITLDALYTDTRVEFVPDLTEDEIRLDDAHDDSPRVSRFLNLVRQHAGIDQRARVTTTNNFPTGAGLASSASGFAALALAASTAAGLALEPRGLSILARQGSGSAARSIFGGFVQMHRGHTPDGGDAYAEPLLAAEAWPLQVVVAITQYHAKSVNSTVGMRGSADSSAFFDAWVSTAEPDLAAMRIAIAERDFHALGELAEYSCLKMHALMLSTRPGLIYWNAGTLAAMQAIRRLRADGLPVYFTIDAGPQVKAICPPSAADAVAQALAEVAGVRDVRRTALGPGARLLY